MGAICNILVDNPDDVAAVMSGLPPSVIRLIQNHVLDVRCVGDLARRTPEDLYGAGLTPQAINDTKKALFIYSSGERFRPYGALSPTMYRPAVMNAAIAVGEVLSTLAVKSSGPRCSTP